MLKHFLKVYKQNTMSKHHKIFSECALLLSLLLSGLRPHMEDRPCPNGSGGEVSLLFPSSPR